MQKTVRIRVDFPYELEGLAPSKELTPSKSLMPRSVKATAMIVKHITFEKENIFRGTEDEKI